MNDNDIIKALECCSDAEYQCNKCAFYGKCYGGMVCEEALALINRQNEQIDTLNKEKDYLNSIIYDFVEQVPYYETNAIKKFAAKVNEMSLHTLDDEYMIWKSKFDEILKEMVVSIE